MLDNIKQDIDVIKWICLRKNGLHTDSWMCKGHVFCFNSKLFFQVAWSETINGITIPEQNIPIRNSGLIFYKNNVIGIKM